jgi:hypothetical protein
LQRFERHDTEEGGVYGIKSQTKEGRMFKNQLQRSVFAIAAVALVYKATAATIQIPGFFQAANEVTFLSSKPPPLSHDDQIRIAELTCKALTDLVNDTEFIKNMDNIPASTRRIRLSGVMPYTKSAADFAHNILTAEGDALRKEGLDDTSTKQALGEMERVRQDLAEHPDKFSSLLPPQNIVIKIASVAQTACDLESRLKSEGNTSRVPDELVRRIAIGLLAGAVIATDVLGELPSEGVASLSIEFGARLLVE